MKSDIRNIKRVWLIGIGGIGMSALARYFMLHGLKVEGYDLISSALTETLQNEGAKITFSDKEEDITENFLNKDGTLVIFTPAVPNNHPQLCFFKENGFLVKKRSEVLGMITENSKAIAISGTHGKTTISTMTAYLFASSKVGGTAFLGGISKNYNSNFIWNEQSPFVVLEADEYDKSFLQLYPTSALISAVDADHLDIYKSLDNIKSAFRSFVGQIKKGGNLVIKEGVSLNLDDIKYISIYKYSITEKSDFYAENIELIDGKYHFNIKTPSNVIENCQLGVPGLLNLENAVGAAALAWLNGVENSEIVEALKDFKGIARRFDKRISSDKIVYIDDYAHHPAEIEATLRSVKSMYPDKKVVAIFQPHLYSRTQDFAKEFGESLNYADELFLIDIYPARELPIEGVNSQLIGRYSNVKDIKYCDKYELVDKIELTENSVIITMGAGDIDRIVADLEKKIINECNLNF